MFRCTRSCRRLRVRWRDDLLAIGFDDVWLPLDQRRDFARALPIYRRELAAVLAVGHIRTAGNDSGVSPRLLRELIATDLSRVPGLDVVGHERLEELLAQRGPRVDSGGALLEAARRAGATRLLEGILSRRADGRFRLDVRQIDVARGILRDAHTVEKPDLFALADAITAEIAAQVGRAAPGTPLAAVTSTSLTARRFYEEGIRVFYAGDRLEARRLFDASLREDSTFAMAAFYAAKVRWALDRDQLAHPFLEQAARMSARGPERDRLMIAAARARVANDPTSVALAESLTTRYPLEPDGHLALGQALSWWGDFDRSAIHLRWVIDHDSGGASAASLRRGAPCRSCEAWWLLFTAYVSADSTAAAERLAHEWIRREPAHFDGWRALSDVYARTGRSDDAIAAAREASRLLGENLADAKLRGVIAMRGGELAEADRVFATRSRDAEAATRTDGLWWRVISLRQQGRLREALNTVDSYARAMSATGDRGSLPSLARAQVLFELGRPREAATLFESLASQPPPGAEEMVRQMPGLAGRHYTWHLIHAANAYAAAGDTLRVAALADTIEAWGSREAYGRDRRLHHYARGLLLEARGDNRGAEAAFRRAIYSPTVGYTRVNLALSRVLVAAGRPREAVPVLHAALRGNLDASNYYVTRTELHETLARAWDASGEVDSARTNYARVASSWAAADEPYRARARRAGTWVRSHAPSDSK